MKTKTTAPAEALMNLPPRVIIPAILLCACASGCTWFQNDVNRGYSENGAIIGGRVYTTADIRIISQRKHPVTDQMVSCTEPSPDIAKALSTASQISLKGGNKTASGEAGAAGGSSESVAELAGRSTALIALRDGLYRTCEAYVNGAIGADAYSLVLSRYGQLMTTLFLAEDIRSAERAAAAATSPTLINLTGLQSAATDKAASTSATTDSSKDTSGTGQSNSGKSSTGTKTPTSTTAVNPLDFLKVATSSGTSSSTTPKDIGNTAAKQADTQTSPTTTSDPKTATDTKDTDNGVAAQLVKLNQSYFDLDRSNLDHLLIVACVNEFDLTRKRSKVETATQGQVLGSAGNSKDAQIVDVYGQNGWLRAICNTMKDINTLSQLQAMSQSSHQTDPSTAATGPAVNGAQQDTPKVRPKKGQHPTT